MAAKVPPAVDRPIQTHVPVYQPTQYHKISFNVRKNKIINVRIHFDLFFSDMGQTQDMNIIYPLELPFVRTDPISRHTHPYIALVNATSPNEQIRPRWRRVGAPPRRLDEAADFQNQPRTWFPV